MIQERNYILNYNQEVYDLVYDKVIKGRFVDLRSITLDDAEFSYNIRADRKNRELVGQPAALIEEQREFIKWQMSEPNDYYFVALNKKGERIVLWNFTF